jgi:hypothetical protein
MWGNFLLNLSPVGFRPSYYRVRATLVTLGITLRLFIRRVGYSNLMLCIYTVPGCGGGCLNP